VGFFNQGDGFKGMQDLLGGFGQSSMTSRGFDYQLQQQQFQSASTQAVYPGKVWQDKPNSISCPECDKTLDYAFDRDCYGPCSCGHREGIQTSAQWLESRIQEVMR